MYAYITKKNLHLFIHVGSLLWYIFTQNTENAAQNSVRARIIAKRAFLSSVYWKKGENSLFAPILIGGDKIRLSVHWNGQ